MLRARSSSRALIAAFAIILSLAGRPAPVAAETPQPSAAYAPDRIILQFRTAPTETDLEAFEGRHFLSLADYIGLDYPAGEGWYVFHIEDRMDASLVRDLLHADPAVCIAELIPQGERNATTGLPPDREDAPECVPLPSQAPTLVPLPTDLNSDGHWNASTGAPPGGSGLDGMTALVLVLLVAAGGIALAAVLLRGSRSARRAGKIARHQPGR